MVITVAISFAVVVTIIVIISSISVISAIISRSIRLMVMMVMNIFTTIVILIVIAMTSTILFLSCRGPMSILLLKHFGTNMPAPHRSRFQGLFARLTPNPSSERASLPCF